MNNTPSFFLTREESVIGTPVGISASERTRDIPFHDFAKDYDLQTALRLLSSVFIKPDALYARPREGEHLIHYCASYLSSFRSSPEERKSGYEYLVNNGTVRILAIDDKLRTELDKIQATHETDAVYNTLEMYEEMFGRIKVDGMYRRGVDFATNQPVFKCRKRNDIE